MPSISTASEPAADEIRACDPRPRRARPPRRRRTRAGDRRRRTASIGAGGCDRHHAAASAGTSAGGASRPASTPPSIGSVVPVIQPARSLAQEEDGLDHVGGHAVAAERMEPGRPPSSTSRATSGVRKRSYAGVSTNASATVLTRMPCGGELDREVLRQRVATRLGRGVGARRRRRDRVERPHRADVDDRAAAALVDHRARGRLRGRRTSAAGSSRAPPRSAPRSARGTASTRKIPVLLTSTSTAPKRSTALSIERRRGAGRAHVAGERARS